MKYDDTNKGAIWKNEKRKTDKHPHFTGQANIDGVEYWVSAWKRDEDAKDNAPVLRFAFTAKDEKRREAAPVDDLDDPLPF